MTTLYTLAEQVREMLQGQRQGSRFHMQEIIKVVGQTRDLAIRFDYFGQIAENEREIAPELISYKDNVEVQYDTASRTDYIELPWEVLRLPRNAGLVKISSMCNLHRPYIPARAGDLSLLNNHAAFHTAGRPSYRIEGSKAKFTKTIKNKYPKAQVAIIRASGSFEEDEELTLPPDMEENIVLRAYEKLVKRMPEDKVFDNADKL